MSLLILGIQGEPRSFEAILQFHISLGVVKCVRLYPVHPVILSNLITDVLLARL
jgi:hypothetical protein